MCAPPWQMVKWNGTSGGKGTRIRVLDFGFTNFLKEFREIDFTEKIIFFVKTHSSTIEKWVWMASKTRFFFISCHI